MQACSPFLPGLFQFIDFLQCYCFKTLLLSTPARLVGPVACMVPQQQCLPGLLVQPSAVPAATLRNIVHLQQHRCRSACTACPDEIHHHLQHPAAPSVKAQSESAASTTQLLTAHIKRQQQQQKQRTRQKGGQKQARHNISLASGPHSVQLAYPEQLGQLLLMQTPPAAAAADGMAGSRTGTAAAIVVNYVGHEDYVGDSHDSGGSQDAYQHTAGKTFNSKRRKNCSSSSNSSNTSQLLSEAPALAVAPVLAEAAASDAVKPAAADNGAAVERSGTPAAADVPEKEAAAEQQQQQQQQDDAAAGAAAEAAFQANMCPAPSAVLGAEQLADGWEAAHTGSAECAARAAASHTSTSVLTADAAVKAAAPPPAVRSYPVRPARRRTLSLAVSEPVVAAATLRRHRQQRCTSSMTGPTTTSSSSSSKKAMVQQRLQDICKQSQQRHQLRVNQQQNPSHWAQQQQQQQQHWPPQLLLSPPAGAAQVDVSFLLNGLASSVPPADHQGGAGSSWGVPQQKSAAAQVFDELDAMLWVSVYQPAGAGSDAAVWVGQYQQPLEANQIQELPGGLLLLNVPCRPDLGPRPQAVVSNLEFNSRSSSSSSRSTSRSTSSLIPNFNTGSTGASATATAGLGNGIDQQEQVVEVAGAGTAESKLASTLWESSAVAAAAAESHLAGPAQAPAAAAGSSQGWHDYLVAVSGHYSSDEHDNMWPHVLASMADGRVLHNARNAADVASFVAMAELPELRQHALNLIRWAFDRKGDSSMYGPQWVMTRLQQRWGTAALLQFGVDLDFLSDCIKELVPLPAAPVANEAGVLLPVDN